MQPILEAMAVRREPALLGLDSQRLLAVWAVKTVYRLELASRQRYPGARLVKGYQPSTPEIGWLLAQLEQRPRQAHRAAALDGVAGLLGLQDAERREPGKHRELCAV